MSDDKPTLVDAIEGYEIIVALRSVENFKQVKIIRLHLNRVGGAHVTRPEDLIRQIEDAVFLNEEGVK